MSSVYKGRSWTKCSTRRFVMAIRRFTVSSCRFVVSARRFLKSTRRIASSIRRLVSFVVPSFRRFVMSFHRFFMSFRRFVMAFLVSTRPLREAIIRRTYMKCLLDFMHSYMTYLSVICYVPTEKGFFEELPTAQHRIRVKSSESMSGFMKVKMKPDV